LVTRQIASLAIRLNTIPPGSVGFGSREDMPIVTRSLETSEMPTSDPPWRILNLVPLPAPFTYFWASRVASGATEVDPLIVIVAA